MLSYIEETLPSTLHLSVSSENTLHFYCYLCIHVLITNKQFILLIDVPIQDQSQQLSIYKIFTLNIPHGTFTTHYDVNTKYLRITQNETMAVEFCHNNSGFVKNKMDSFLLFLHCFNHLQTHHLALLPYIYKNTPSISAKCSLQIRKSSDVSMPSQLVPSV